MAMHQPTLDHDGTILDRLVKEPARPAFIRKHVMASWFVVATVCFGAFMGQLDASIITLAFPALEHQFNTRLAAVEWVSLAYLIALVILLVPIGKLSDRYGRKLFYMYGFLVFTAASAACGFASSLLVLVTFRLLQAAGAAMLQANSVALVATSTTAKHRRAALGVQAAAQSLGLALGPVVGGILVATVGWRWIFFINLPVGIVALISGLFLLPRTHQRSSPQPTDVPGLLLLAVSVTATLVLMSGVSGLGLTATESVLLAVLSAAALIGLVRWENHADFPLIDFTMLRSTGLAHMLFGALLAYMVLFGPLVLFPHILVAKGFGILKAGLLLSALPLGFGLSAVGVERVFPGHWPDRKRAILGGLLATAGAVLLAVPAPDFFILAMLGLLGIGLGIYIPANNAGIMSSVTKRQAAVTGGMVNIARGLGTAFGVAIVALALNVTKHSSADRSSITTMLLLSLAALAATWAGRHVRIDTGQSERARSDVENL